MQFNTYLFLIIFVAGHVAAKSQKCDEKISVVIKEMEDWPKYGIKRDPRGVVEFPNKCTPFMKSKSMIPLSKRKAAGVNRERYLGADCNIYEWDSQHGAFEVYKPNSNNTYFYHSGENSAVLGEVSEKIDSKRNHDFAETGLSSMRMKDLCKKHKSGNIGQNDLKKLSKNGLSCI